MIVDRRPRRRGPGVALLLLPVAWLTVSLAACGGAAPPPVVSAPTPAPATSPVPAPAGPRAVRYALPTSIPATVYAVQVRTALERDSAGQVQRDAVESSARVTLSLRRDRRGGLRGTGRVDAFVVRAGPALTGTRVPTVGTPLTPAMGGTPESPLSVAIDVALDSLVAIATVQPALANECDRPESVAASLARDILVRVPDSVAVGERWRDSLVTVACRGGIPMTVRTIVESTLSGVSERGGSVTLDVRRTLTSHVEGVSRLSWRQVQISGDGRGTQRATIDGARGALLELDGESTLVVRIRSGSGRDAARTQQVTQQTTVSVRVAR